MRNLQIPGDGTIADNQSWLENMADEVIEGFSYHADLTEEELDQERRDFAAVSIRIAQIEEEKDRVLGEINERLKKTKGEAKLHLTLIRTRRREVVGTVYELTDEREGRAGVYDVNGVLISSRRKSDRRSPNMFVGEALPYVPETDEFTNIESKGLPDENERTGTNG